MNLSALRAEVQANIADTTTATSTRITTWLNFAVNRMARWHDWLDLVGLDKTTYDTTVSVETVSIASTVKKIYNVRYVDTSDGSKSRQLIYRPAYLQNTILPYPAGDATGTPVFYWMVGRTMYLSPIPDASKDLYLTRHIRPTAMSSGTSSPSITNADDAIVAGATYWAYLSMPQLDGAEYVSEWLGMFRTLAQEANAEDQKLPGWRPILRRHNAFGLSGYLSVDPTSDPFNRQGNRAR